MKKNCIEVVEYEYKNKYERRYWKFYEIETKIIIFISKIISIPRQIYKWIHKI
ncbi:hypothetical protein HDR60_03975 [bacterium]|nr:hypothetical protein [bacterium]